MELESGSGTRHRRLIRHHLWPLPDAYSILGADSNSNWTNLPGAGQDNKAIIYIRSVSIR